MTPDPEFVESVRAHVAIRGVRATLEALWQVAYERAGDAQTAYRTAQWGFLADRVEWFRNTYAVVNIDREEGIK